MAAFVGGDLGEHRTQAHFQEARDGGGDLDAPQVEAIGTGQLNQDLALHVQKGRQDGRHGLAVQGHEVARRRHGIAHGWFRLVDDKPVDRAVLERTLAGDAALFAMVDGALDGEEFPLPHHGEVSQAFLDGPIRGRRAPIEAGLIEGCGQFAGLLLNLFKLLAIEFQLGKGHSRGYSR